MEGAWSANCNTMCPLASRSSVCMVSGHCVDIMYMVLWPEDLGQVRNMTSGSDAWFLWIEGTWLSYC